MKLNKWTLSIWASVIVITVLTWFMIVTPKDKHWWISRDQEIDLKGIRYEELEEKGIVPPLIFGFDEKISAEWEDGDINFVAEEGTYNPTLWFSADYSTITIPRKNIKSIKWPKGEILIEFRKEK